MRHVLRALAVSLLLCATTAWAQTTSGSMSGTVIDAQKQVVPGADVLITNEQNGETRRTVTNEVGAFTFPRACTRSLHGAGLTDRLQAD